MANKPFTLRLSDEVKKELEFISHATKRSPSSIAAEVLASNIPIRAQRMRMIQEAKKEAENGAFISQEAMETWVDSLGTSNELPLPEPDVFRK